MFENQTKSKKFLRKGGPQSLWLFVFNGKPHAFGLATLKQYQEILTPLIQTQLTHPISMNWNITDQNSEKTLNLVLSYYKDLVRAGLYFPGVYGDWIKTSIIKINQEQYLNLDIIGQAAWNKPTLAADLGIFIQDKTQMFFIGVTRKNKPGQGKPAIIGGIMNAKKELDSGAYTMIKEAWEETHFKMEYIGKLEELRQNYEIQKIPVIIKNFDKLNKKYTNIKGEMQYVSCIPTTEQERIADGTKRVYLAVAYCILINLPDLEITKDDLKKIFRAGDDAAGLFITEVSESFRSQTKSGIPAFGLNHHPKLFKKMVFHLLDHEEIWIL